MKYCSLRACETACHTYRFISTALYNVNAVFYVHVSVKKAMKHSYFHQNYGAHLQVRKYKTLKVHSFYH
jgi:hypothetical protein